MTVFQTEDKITPTTASAGQPLGLMEAFFPQVWAQLDAELEYSLN